MCVELITLAMCSSASTDREPVYCGRFHLVTGERIVCDEASCKCIYSFGTCGKIETESPAGFSVSDIMNLPCIPCATRMGDRLKNQEILEPFLIKGSHLHGEYLEQKLKVLQAAGHEDSTCPSHGEGSATKGKATVEEPAKKHIVARINTKLAVSSAPAEASVDEVGLHSEGSESARTHAAKHYGEDSASAADPWTGAPIVTEPYNAEHAMTKSTITETPFEKDDDESAVVANDNGGETSIKAGSDAGNGNEKGLEDDTTPITRRAVNFQYSAEAADKLRDTTEKFASLKSGFLMGKAF
ncbi:hypothetical protein FVEN_g11572 [Fusarium venenatum]|uniref:Uncharacterized protein n=1 Tax=Fusarium venenatum TaxID=56646 RepID=A0A2L2T957_9HYPO|nr:uncharacterized protein FVRRES_03964 [Fusarium venenatum]KAG8350256.1 hypothetical protein FVEN_g11572 [Fusarium venenatum]KAH7003064.1 hypothetical protein EDB82DRAFT_570243 [Fusarium venenatum]CEI67452.1 unnamed protein product [Fusarium venenatum]